MSAHIRLNTDKEYPCLLCGTLGNIIRESDDLAERRIKCNAPRCNFTYSAADSVAAKERGEIPNGPSDSESVQPEEQSAEDRTDTKVNEADKSKPTNTSRSQQTIKAPRTPSFVILSKDRFESEFCTKKNLRERVIVWTAQEKKFDVFQLLPKKVAAKLSIE